jgi:hypothetical protein
VSPVSAELRQKVFDLRHKFAPGWLEVVSVAEGWYRLVAECDRELSVVDPAYKILQIKEKFGGLRYYVEPSKPELLDQLNAITQKYEELSLRTCEATGDAGVLMRSVGGWYRTLNPGYAKASLSYFDYKPVDQAKE